MGKGAGAIVGGAGQYLTAGQGEKAAQTGYNNALNNEQNSLGYLNPYLQAGNSALSPLTGLLTGNSYDPTTGQTTALSADQRNNLLSNSPGYQFALDQGNQALDRSQAARGLTLSGGAQKEISQYNTGMASQNYNNYIGQLGSLAGMGQNAANSMAGVNSDISGLMLGKGLNKQGYYNNVGNIFGNTASQVGQGYDSTFGMGNNGSAASGSGGGSNGFTSAGGGQVNSGFLTNAGGAMLNSPFLM